ncbi:hypothetical protein BDN72DRAFT_832783 [Pluteus cervinus]|uniref:Uncharacterized protein n=1 Tax=Pluteus cervinus TaxID=181527 RepID=A0ACD3BCK0_9AGAR|nr:hypothetical protein BDN72DRAFT_832783 [Pluteus cervinus]
MAHFKFPRTRAQDDPPALRGTLYNGRKTPVYALAWVCKRPEYIKRFGDFPTLEYDIERRWSLHVGDKYGFGLAPYIEIGEDGNIYCVAAYNLRPMYLDLPVNDPELLIASRHALKIQEKDEHTLKWYKLPLSWVCEVDNLAKPEVEASASE